MGAPETKYVKSADGTHIAYEVFGRGLVDLVWIPGYLSHCELAWENPDYARFMERLGSFARVVTFDKRGTGQSDRAASLPSLDVHMDDLAAVLEAAGVARATLVGYSEGGPLGILFAATYPQRITSLILFGTYVRVVRTDDFPIGIPQEMLDSFADFVERSYGTGAMLEIFAPTIARDPAHRKWFGYFERQAGSPGTVRALTSLYSQIDVRSALPAITAPTLVLHRKDELAVRPEQARYLAAHIKGARLVELEGVDHIPFVGDQDSLVAEIQEFMTGERPEPDADRVLGTVLFTDIVSSTEHAAAAGDHEWRSILDAHHERTRAALRRFGGREVKTTGDGFFAMFDRPGRAVHCAVSLVADVHELGIEIRAGLHTGECELVGNDVAGIAVHIASRVSALAGAGEVFVTRTVRDLVVGSGIAFADRGTHALKGVPDEWSVYSVSEGVA